MNPALCPDCGASLPAGALAGLCAACLLKLGEQTSAAEDAPTLIDQSLSNESPGTRIGRYKLLEAIGEGGFGTVWMAEQEEPVRRRVALKIIKLGMDTRAVVARFEAERQALALMEHPHIAKVLDGGATDTGRPYFVMELVRGVPVTDYCDGRKLTPRERLELFIPVCQAVQHAHQKGIIHRDLKPSNILVTEQDGRAVPKVIDFGIAKATEQKLTEKTLFTRFNQMIGTPAYMSPEQAGLGGLDIDTRSDVYSLGVLLYELLTGRTPFDHRKLMEAGYEAILKTIRETEPPKPSTRLSSLTAAELTEIAARRGDQPAHLNKLLRGELDWIVLKALEKDRNRRYETANGLARDLERFLNNEPVTAVAPSPAYRLKKWAGRNRLVVGAGSVVTAALLIGLGTSLWFLRQANTAKLEAIASGEKEHRARTEAETARAAVSVERDRTARLLSVSQAEQGVQLLEQGDPVGLLHLVEARKTVEHLPEERLRRTLLWSGWMNSLPKNAMRLLDAPSAVGTAGDYFRRQPLAPHVGQPWIVAGSTNGEVTLSEPGTGRTITTFSTGNQQVGSPELSANGRLLVVNANGSFQLWDLAPVRSNQPPRRLLGRIHRIGFDPQHQRVLTFANQDLPMPGESPEFQGEPAAAAGFQLQIWDSEAEPPLITTWAGDRQDLKNHDFALNADGSKVAAGDQSLSLWDAKSGQPAQPAINNRDASRPRNSFDPFWFSPDGRWLWDVRRTVCLRYDLGTGQLAGEPVTGLHRFQRPWLTSDGSHLVISLTNGFQVLHLDRGEPLGPTIVVDDDVVRALALSPDGRRLATAGPDRALRIWDTTTGTQAGPTYTPPEVVTSASFTPDGRALELTSAAMELDTTAMSTGLRSVRTRILSIDPTPSSWVTHWPGVRVLGFNEAGELLTYTKAGGTMERRDPATGNPSLAWPVSNAGELIGSAISPDSSLVAAAFREGQSGSRIRFWNTTTGQPAEPGITWTNLGALAFSPDGQTLAGLGGADGSGSIQLWDVTSRQPRAFLPADPKQVSWLALWFSPDGRYIAARNSYAISVWDVAAGKLASGGPIDFYLSISDDWKWAIGLELFDFTDPRNPRPAPHPLAAGGGTNKRSGMALSPDGRLRAAEAGDRKIRLWDNLTERPASREMKLANPARQMSFSPDGRLLLVFEWNMAGMRGVSAMSLRLWETSTGLPCGPSVPLDDLPVEWLFDRDVRWLTQKAPFDVPNTLRIQLPARDVSLAEMERQSGLLSGCRLDEAGNVEILSAEEIRQLEAAPRGSAFARPQSPGASSAPAVSPPATQSPAGALPPEIQRFIEARERQAIDFAAQRNRSLPAELTNYFAAARAGNWLSASNAYAGFVRRVEQGLFDETTELYNAVRQPALDSYIAFEYFAQSTPRFATAFGRDIVASLPAGSIYFGGTDPGRGLVTAYAHGRTGADACFVLTQNHLADNSYLDYVRQLHGQEINLPTPQDSHSAFDNYLSDARRRLEHDEKFPGEPRQLKPGEEIRIDGGRVQVSGQVAVMAINALLAKRIFDLNPKREFYVEESFPLEWMQPHLEPHGLIMRLNRAPLDRISVAAVTRDEEYWSGYLKPLVGNWLKEDTTVAELCAFVERVFLRRDLKGFTGDTAFVADPYATKAFSRLRSSIAGVYRWRATQAQNEAERQRMQRAADFAFRQALALCPSSPDAVFRYCRALAEDGRVEDALKVARVAVQFPEISASVTSLIRELESGR